MITDSAVNGICPCQHTRRTAGRIQAVNGPAPIHFAPTNLVNGLYDTAGHVNGPADALSYAFLMERTIGLPWDMMARPRKMALIGAGIVALGILAAHTHGRTNTKLF